MNGLARRLERLETAEGVAKRHFLWVDHASDGGLVHDGKFYPDTDALLSSLGLGPDGAFILGWQGKTQTAAELLAEAEERAKNPPPPVSIDDLGESAGSWWRRKA
jgi:hypothetical protein